MNLDHDNKLDDAIRAVHAQSLEHLSPRVRAQLQQRRRAALAGQAPQATRSPWRFAFPLAAACAVGALALGLQLRGLQQKAPEAPTHQVVATTEPAPAAPVVPAATLPGADDATATATLEENPDLYVWLASDDAALMAME
jgi:hypothetical protein